MRIVTDDFDELEEPDEANSFAASRTQLVLGACQDATGQEGWGFFIYVGDKDPIPLYIFDEEPTENVANYTGYIVSAMLGPVFRAVFHEVVHEFLKDAPEGKLREFLKDAPEVALRPKPSKNIH